PGRSETVRSLAAGQIQVGPISASSKTAAPGKPVLLKTTISGQNIGYVKLLIGYLDRAGKSINVADSDYLDSPQTAELNGVYYHHILDPATGWPVQNELASVTILSESSMFGDALAT
ncbi:MAG: FAD:protein FMN transferase, partial [Anaerolineae bacterium]